MSHGHSGFSLTELMIAVGIISGMSVIAIPSFDHYKARATRAEAKATMSRIFTAQELYYSQYDVYCKFLSQTSKGVANTNPIKPNLDISIPDTTKFFYGIKNGNDDKHAVLESDDSKYKVLAKAKRQNLAGCSNPNKPEKWCVDSTGFLSNIKSEAQNSDNVCKKKDVFKDGC
ncbi:MAG: prepilin-type N-terminal cleavage/methylation domain-containing protein [Proteobacteria bacterium]|nr:prepilin-type N-terminal cleavage/methylation domain-containing protein [Pseudomonadota bacterium]